ncbi:carboxypeptidase-like regulatory domain-containing protein [Pedobacter sp. LMG 31464]|uniref:Carboxypeptidase-like regulatory domain-containing protein n=1 Tax=Pedobacter planticolens TaxID=2679964 RepID=A0A923E2M5_9SPHI|nr:carboxypeptidase-like regulatory domain-containing protein [Pedobacter planticolens]MBB2147263.1 carboxypeptidase-like regulatory domain-containing protein [Pedobacter planticolens]
MFRVLSLFCLILFSSIQGFSQNTFSITGIVKDKKETLPGAGVYVSGYKIATATDADGKFRLPNLKPGSYDILVQMMGYLPFSKNIIISDKSVQVEFVLKENAVMLNEVVIRVDPNRQKYINQFKQYFIGKTPNAKLCKILNPQVLRVDYDITRSTLTVKTDEFLIVENKALGYRIKYMLDYFEYNSRTNIIYYSGKPFFEELKASNAKKKKYIELREIAYYGSAQHFFKSLYKGTSREEGFIIHKIIKIPNQNRAPDSIIYKNMMALKNPPGKTGIRKTAAKIDTSLLAYWQKQQALPKYIDKFNNAEVLPDTLVHYYNKDLKFLDYTNALCVMYTKERESTEYSNSGFWVFRPLYIPDYELSVAKLTDGPIRFYEGGGILDARSLLFEGFWAYEKVADMVPMDYIPLAKRSPIP